MLRRGSLRARLGFLQASAFFACGLIRVGAHAHDAEPPKAKHETPAHWPDGKVDAHDVLVPVALTVSARGTVETVVVEASVSPAFDREAIVAARTWTFEPAMRDGKAVAARVRGVVRFFGRAAGGVDTTPADVAGSAAPVKPDPEPTGKALSVLVRGKAPPRGASETVRGQDVIAAAPHRTASDALSVVPGVFVTQHSGEGKAHQIFLRGFDAQHGQDIELWVGGIPVNEVSNIHGQGYADLHFAMPEIVKEIRSTPGTYDPRQGDFAVAGSLRLALGYDEPGITAKAGLGSFGARRMFLAYHPKDTSDENFAAFEQYDTNGFGPNRAARRGSFVAQMSHDFGEGFAIRALGMTYSGRYDSAGVVRASDLDSGRIDRYGLYDPKQGGYSSKTQFLVELHRDEENQRWSFAPFVVFRSLTLRSNFTGFLEDTQRGGKPQIDSDNTQQIHEDMMIGATASYRHTMPVFSPQDEFEVGFYGRNDWIEQSQRRLSDVNDAPTSTLVDAKIQGTNIGGYLDLSLHPLRRLAVRGGVRGDILSYSTQDQVPTATGDSAQKRSAQGTHLGKKLTLDYALIPSIHALASYGEGFRSPQARSLAEGEKTPFTEVTSYETGLRFDQGQRLTGSIAVFHTRLSQDLAFDQATARNEVVPGTRRTGAAAEMTVRPTPWFLMSGNITYTRAEFSGSDAKYNEGDLLPYVPQVVARTDAAVRRTLTRLWNRDLEGRFGTGLSSLIRRPLPYSEIGSNVFLVDMSAGVRLGEVELGIDLYNALDSFFYDGQFVYASNFSRSSSPQLVPVRHVTVGPPRSIFASLTLHI